jgi:hypothetical protein
MPSACDVNMQFIITVKTNLIVNGLLLLWAQAFSTWSFDNELRGMA